MTTFTLAFIMRRIVSAVAVAGTVLACAADAQTTYVVGRTPFAEASVTVAPSGTDDTARLQHIIDKGTGAVRFQAGVYHLSGPLHLRSNRSYIGEGSWDPRYGSVLRQKTPGAAIFDLDGPIYSVTISGLTFDATPGVSAKGIAAATSAALLASSTIRDSYFLTSLAECIDVPMVLTRIERNQFGINGSWIGVTHQHIHSVSTGQDLATNANWLIGNRFSQARGSESVFFEQGVQLQVEGNDFEGNVADTTLRINGMNQVVIEGNYFENNAGQAQISLENAPQVPIGDYIVRLENNYYNMNGGNQYVLAASGATHVYMGYESGTSFASGADLTSRDAFQNCYLRVTGPFHLVGYSGIQTAGNPACH